jgi:hypothetical protein
LGLVIRDIVGLVHVALELIQLGCKPDDEIGWYHAILTAAIRQASGVVCIVASRQALSQRSDSVIYSVGYTATRYQSLRGH